MYPFTATQWQELEHQALVFKYMVCGMPIPQDLLFTIRRSLDSSSKFLLHQVPQHVGWNSFHMGFGRKIDPEPGRCRRTDGKKWRCSKEAYPDSKYCERHMHRGRNRSRKPVETSPNISSITKDTTNSSSSSARQENYFFLGSNAYASTASKDYRNSYGHSGTSRNVSTSNDSWQLTLGDVKQNPCNTSDINNREILDGQQPNKIMHHFLDEWPPKDNEDYEDKLLSHRTQLSISVPNPLHDFFMTQNDK